jgi:ankyrin repeat protein
VVKGNIELVQLLLLSGADVNGTTICGEEVSNTCYGGYLPGSSWRYCGGNITALQAAAVCGTVGIFRLLLDAGAIVNYCLSNRIISELVKKDDVQMVRLLLDAGIDFNCPRDGGDMTPLQCAVEKGYIQLVRLLLDGGADANYVPNLCSITALEVAAKNGNVDVVRLLLDSGADITYSHQQHRAETPT